jgi:muramoyltetrapeptide carboxypeptidase LdcA involved in peptidoglycan recycling
MRFPKTTGEGVIGYVAPSFGCAIEPYRSAFQNALKKLEARGMKAKLGANVYADAGIGISSTPEKCAGEFMDMYLDEEAELLVSCGGGELMCEILPFLDFDALRAAEPKWFMGYSDNTNITFLLTTLTDTASVYGPCAASFGMEPWHPAIEDAFLLLTGQKYRMTNYPMWERESLKDEEHPLEPYHVTEPFRLQTNRDEQEFEVSGRLLGGCLDCLSKLVGTKFDRVREFAETYRDDGILWFLECCDLNVMDMRRSLWQLREAGWFSHARGFLIGRPMHYDEPMMGLDRYDAVLGALSELKVPVIMDLDIGHTAPMMPIICGARATASVKKGSFVLDMVRE